MGRVRRGSADMFQEGGSALQIAIFFGLTGLIALEDLSTNLAQFSDDGLWQLTLLSNLKQLCPYQLIVIKNLKSQNTNLKSSSQILKLCDQDFSFKLQI